jgi:hypothetical protein
MRRRLSKTTSDQPAKFQLDDEDFLAALDAQRALAAPQFLPFSASSSRWHCKARGAIRHAASK